MRGAGRTAVPFMRWWSWPLGLTVLVGLAAYERWRVWHNAR